MPRRIVLLALAALALAGCSSGPQRAAVFTSGDAGRGRDVIQYYGCGSCHSIGGIDTARGQVGPPLNGVRDRVYIAGMLQNDPTNMARWIRNPKTVNPQTAMPYLGVTDKDAEDIVAYLYSLR